MTDTQLLIAGWTFTAIAATAFAVAAWLLAITLREERRHG